MRAKRLMKCDIAAAFDRGSVLTRACCELISGKKVLQPTSHRTQTVAAI